MGKNKKLRKRIEGLKRAREEHLQKIEEYEGGDEFLIPYWEKEIESIDGKIRDEERKLED